jgi:threonylcarbamoyladenosine tRNA methylthiotransferase CDKAL1
MMNQTSKTPFSEITNTSEPAFEVRGYGCSDSKGDALRIADALVAQGQAARYAPEEEINDNSQSSKLPILLNVCTVKGDDGARSEIKKALEQNAERPILISGCVTPALASWAQNLQQKQGLPVLVAKSKDTAGLTEEMLQIQNLKAQAARRPLAKLNPVVGLLQVSQGCLDRCAFCSTVQVKGKLRSKSAHELRLELQDLVAAGSKEIWLTGQDVACWGLDIGLDLADLLKELTGVEGDFRMRLGMGNPRHLKGRIDRILPYFESDKLLKFLHLPIQSGSDEVLKHMRRGHRNRDMLEIIETLRNQFPTLTLSTDLITAHPGETDQDFEQTLQMLRWMQPVFTNHTRFVPRPGTPAAQMTLVPGSIAKERSRALTEACKEVSANWLAQFVGQNTEILCVEDSPEGQIQGRNDHYLPIRVSGNSALGSKHLVKIESARAFALSGRLEKP